jgi:1-acyl-sn-glycerol-3-phosphate acyltransferase
MSLMNRTPVKWLASQILKLVGWTAVYEPPDVSKYIIVAAPHTSNWDLPLGLTYAIASGLRFKWLGKDEVFRFPFGGIFRLLGGVPVNRRESTNFVDQVAERFAAEDELVIAITPAGTRSNATYWKTGFYYIAIASEVPIAMAFLDYSTQSVGYDTTIWPSGDIEADIKLFQDYYRDKIGKYPDRQREIRIRPRSETAD